MQCHLRYCALIDFLTMDLKEVFAASRSMNMELIFNANGFATACMFKSRMYLIYPAKTVGDQ